MEGEMEVSVMELYYSAKNCFCEYKKGIVCGIVAIVPNNEGKSNKMSAFGVAT